MENTKITLLHHPSDPVLEADLLQVHLALMEATLLAPDDFEGVIRRCGAEDLTACGTGKDEVLSSVEEYVRLIARSKAQLPLGLAYHYENLNIRIVGEVALLDGVIDLSFALAEERVHMNTRLSAAYQRKGQSWKAIHVHLSFPSSEQAEGESWPIDVLKARNQELEEKVARRTEELRTSLEKLKNTQTQLIQAEKLASLGELTAGIAHEIQNPLNFVNNFSEVNAELLIELKEEIIGGNTAEALILAEDIHQNMGKIVHHGRRADSIVKNMLQHARQPSGEKEFVNLNALVDEYLRLSYHGLRAKDKSFNATMETDFDEAVGKVEMLPQEMGRVLLNLFNNAFYSVVEKKRVLGTAFKPILYVATKKTESGIEIKVKDNGMGIPEEVLAKIYQPFFTTKPTGEGTGLGLSMSYDIVTKGHGGSMKAHTKEGEYAEFDILLPA
ncbi:sensor histidine kinase [Rufibacter hautae]|nr:ATP-binding protein [Rufibacter hautae]